MTVRFLYSPFLMIKPTSPSMEGLVTRIFPVPLNFMYRCERAQKIMNHPALLRATN